MTKTRRIRTGLLGLPLLAFAWPGVAAEPQTHHPRHHALVHKESVPKSLGGSHSWNAYSYEEKEASGKPGKVCYLIGDPQRTEPANLKRKPPTAMVTHRPAEKVANVVSFVEGYPLKLGSDVAVEIDGTTVTPTAKKAEPFAQKFALFTKADGAWAKDADTDRTIVETMMKGKDAVVRGTPEKGPPTTDTYSLLGFSEALALIDKACGIKR